MEDFKKPVSVLKNISELIPIFSISILLLGLLKSFIYFQFFGINILPYLTLTEVGLLLFTEFFTILIFVLTGIFMLNLTKDIGLTATAISNKIFKNPIIEEKKKIPEFQEGHTPVTIFLTVLIILYFIFRSKNPTNELFSALILIGFLVMNMFIANLDIITKTMSKKLFTIITVIIVGIFVICSLTIKEADSTYKGFYLGTEIKTSDTLYISTKDNYYIGKTKSYIFMKNSNTNSITIIPSSEVKRFVLRTKTP